MKLVKNILLLTAASTSLSAFAKEPEIVIASKDQVNYSVTVDDVDVQAANQKFAFDWNNHQTIKSNMMTRKQAEAMLAKIKPDTEFSKKDLQALNSLYYKLGTYYTHIDQQPDIAISKLNQARTMATTKENKSWVFNHLAYAYQLKFAADGQLTDKEKALDFTQKVIALYPNQNNSQVAFAFTIQGLVANTAKNYTQAMDSFKQALEIYDALPNSKTTDQYARVQNQLANVMLERGGQDQEAIALLENLKKHWEDQKDFSTNPYAAQNLMILGEAYLKDGKIQEARDQINQSIEIYKNVFGNNNKQLSEAYKLLAETYEKAGDNKQSVVYLKKAEALKNI